MTGTRAESLLSEEDILGDLPVVLSATRLAQAPAEVPVATTVIDRQMIEATGARSIVDILRLVPGMVAAYESGNRPVVSYHGMTDVYARRMQVLVDGRSVYVPSVGGVPWNDLPLALEDIERIEVIRGPNSATYGANAFLGVISIVTRRANSDRGLYAKVTGGSPDIADGLVRGNGTLGSLDYRLTASYQSDTGFSQRYDSWRAPMFSARADYRINSANNLEFQLGYKGGMREKGHEDLPVNYTHDAGILSRFEQIVWRSQLSSANEISVQLYHNYHDTDERFVTPPVTIPSIGAVPVYVNWDVTTERYDIELQNTLVPAKSLRLVWGLGARIDSVRAPSFFATPGWYDNHMSRAFVSGEWHITPALLLNAGAMLEKNDLTDTQLSPRIAVNYHITPNHTLRYSISKATRNPVLVEELGDARYCLSPDCSTSIPWFYSPGGIQPETITSQELGYVGKWGRRVSLDAKIYHDSLADLTSITSDSLPGVVVNADDAKIKGFELQATYRANAANRVVMGYAYTDIASANLRERYTTSAPSNSASAMVMHDFTPRTQGSLMYYYADGMRFLDAQAIERMQRVDLRLAQTFGSLRREAKLALVVQNLFHPYDEYYPRTEYANAFDRRVYLSLSLNIF